MSCLYFCYVVRYFIFLISITRVELLIELRLRVAGRYLAVTFYPTLTVSATIHSVTDDGQTSNDDMMQISYNILSNSTLR